MVSFLDLTFVKNILKSSLRFKTFKILWPTEGQRPREGKLQSKAVVRNLRLFQFSMTFVSLTFSLPIIRTPDNARFLTSLLSEPGNVKLPLRIVVGLYHMNAIATEWLILLFSFSAVFVFVTVVVDISQALR